MGKCHGSPSEDRKDKNNDKYMEKDKDKNIEELVITRLTYCAHLRSIKECLTFEYDI